MLTLHYATGTISIAVAIALEETGLPYETVRLDFGQGEQTGPDYLSINPKGRVPTLTTEGGAHLTETGALLDYIAALAAHMRGVMYYLASTMHVAHAHKMRGSRWADQQSSFEDMKAKVPQTMAACAAYVDANALRGNYVLGDTFSIADPYLFVVCNWLAGDDVTVATYPAIAAFLKRMEARPSVKAVREKGML
jgi:glutathione S-transferase